MQDICRNFKFILVLVLPTYVQNSDVHILAQRYIDYRGLIVYHWTVKVNQEFSKRIVNPHVKIALLGVYDVIDPKSIINNRVGLVELQSG